MESKKEVSSNLKELLIKIIDAKEQKNVTKKNKEIALKDLIKLLNFYWGEVSKNKEDFAKKGFLNEHQDLWYHSIIDVYKNVKFPLLNITSSLWRCYIITLFESIGEDLLLQDLTGWSSELLRKEKLTYDMKIILLSVNQIIKDKIEEK